MSVKIDKFPDTIEAHNISEYVGKDYVYTTTPTRDVIVIGAKYAAENTKKHKGAVGVYRSNNKTNDTWVLDTVLTDHLGHDNDQYGAVVAINKTGDIIAISAPNARVNGEEKQGRVDLYNYDTATNKWVEFKSFTPPKSKKPQYFGYSMGMDLSADIIVIGNYKAHNPNTNNRGNISIFSMNVITNKWAEDVVRPPVDGVYKDFGKSVVVDPHGVLLTMSVRRKSYNGESEWMDMVLPYDISSITQEQDAMLAQLNVAKLPPKDIVVGGVTVPAAVAIAPVTTATVNSIITATIKTVPSNMISLATQIANSVAKTNVALGVNTLTTAKSIQSAIAAEVAAVNAVVIYKNPPRVKFTPKLQLSPNGLTLSITTNNYTDMFPSKGMLLTYTKVGSVWVKK